MRSFTIRSGEGPFFAVLLSCYLVWLLALWFHQALGPFWVPLAIYTATLHSSLQHETVHGHPSSNQFFNECMVLLPLGLLFPYRRYRSMHLTHHIDSRLTDPVEDPESWYLSAVRQAALSPFSERLLRLNNTLAGRLVIGPWIVLFGLLVSEGRLLLAGNREGLSAWAWHLATGALVLLIVVTAGIPVWFYLLLVAWPAMSLLLLRSFIEHRASAAVSARTAVIEAGPIMSLLYLNNNLHAVHHRHPALAFWKLPRQWRQQRQEVLVENQHYHYPAGYWQVVCRWLFRQREPLRHPFLK